MTTTIQIGQSYRLMDALGVAHDYCILGYDGRTRKHRVADLSKAHRPAKHIRLSEHVMIKPVRQCAVHAEEAKEVPSTTELYIVQTGPGTYKIGCTDDLQARMRAGRTWCADMRAVATRTIPRAKTGAWRRYEGKVHKRFSNKRCARGGSEVFKFTGVELQNAVAYMRRMRFD